MHARHYVSVKAVLYSADAQRVMVMYYPKRKVYGLPGGHIDRGEDPDTALARELMEELRISVDGVQRRDFFYANRIILGYTAVVANDFETFPTDAKKEYAVWCTKEEVAELGPFTEQYRDFIFAHWPTELQLSV